VLALDTSEFAQYALACRSLADASSCVETARWPELPVEPTTICREGEGLTFAWWNNDHREDDVSHAGFELVCSKSAVRGAKLIATGVWYRVTTPN
jgi:hypothetical protein